MACMKRPHRSTPFLPLHTQDWKSEYNLHDHSRAIQFPSEDSDLYRSYIANGCPYATGISMLPLTSLGSRNEFSSLEKSPTFAQAPFKCERLDV